MSNFCAARLLTDSLSVTFATTRWWSVSQSTRTSTTFEYRPSSIKTWAI